MPLISSHFCCHNFYTKKYGKTSRFFNSKLLVSYFLLTLHRQPSSLGIDGQRWELGRSSLPAFPSMTLKDEDSDIQATLSDAPPDWNSDDEPPDDHVGDENTCSRDGAVRKVIKKVGKGLERPGQNDIVTLSFSTFQLDGSDSLPSMQNTTVEMGDNKLPMAVEFAVKHMRVGEICEVRAPAVYSLQTSPLCGRSLRTQPGVLPKTDKVKRRHRFLPAAPRSVSEQAGEDCNISGRCRWFCPEFARLACLWVCFYLHRIWFVRQRRISSTSERQSKRPSKHGSTAVVGLWK